MQPAPRRTPRDGPGGRPTRRGASIATRLGVDRYAVRPERTSMSRTIREGAEVLLASVELRYGAGVALKTETIRKYGAPRSAASSAANSDAIRPPVSSRVRISSPRRMLLEGKLPNDAIVIRRQIQLDRFSATRTRISLIFAMDHPDPHGRTVTCQSSDFNSVLTT